MVKNLPAVLETWVQYLGWEDPLEKGMATHSSILAWKISWTEDDGVAESQTQLSDKHTKRNRTNRMRIYIDLTHAIVETVKFNICNGGWQA